MGPAAIQRPQPRLQGNGVPGEAQWKCAKGVRLKANPSGRVALIVVCGLSLGACAPAYHRIAVPTAAPLAPASWRPARVGDDAVVIDGSGRRWFGTVEALGDSIVLRDHERGARRHAFAPEQVAQLQCRPKAARGEKALPVILAVAMTATVLWLLAMSNLSFN